MKSEKKKYRILIAGSDSSIRTLITRNFSHGTIESIRSADSASQIRTLLSTEPADILIINTPLKDEYGTDLALSFRDSSMGILMMVKDTVFDQVSEDTADSGILALSKPNTPQNFISAVRLTAAVSSRLQKSEIEKNKLMNKVSSLSAVNHAKWLLIEHLHLNEQDAHLYIEKEAMNNRITRNKVAENIIRTYEKNQLTAG